MLRNKLKLLTIYTLSFLLIHLFPMLRFCTPTKTSQFSDIFKEYRNRILGKNGLNLRFLADFRRLMTQFDVLNRQMRRKIYERIVTLRRHFNLIIKAFLDCK